MHNESDGGCPHPSLGPLRGAKGWASTRQYLNVELFATLSTMRSNVLLLLGPRTDDLHEAVLIPALVMESWRYNTYKWWQNTPKCIWSYSKHTHEPVLFKWSPARLTFLVSCQPKSYISACWITSTIQKCETEWLTQQTNSQSRESSLKWANPSLLPDFSAIDSINF